MGPFLFSLAARHEEKKRFRRRTASRRSQKIPAPAGPNRLETRLDAQLHSASLGRRSGFLGCLYTSMNKPRTNPLVVPVQRDGIFVTVPLAFPHEKTTHSSSLSLRWLGTRPHYEQALRGDEFDSGSTRRRGHRRQHDGWFQPPPDRISGPRARQGARPLGQFFSPRAGKGKGWDVCVRPEGTRSPAMCCQPRPATRLSDRGSPSVNGGLPRGRRAEREDCPDVSDELTVPAHRGPRRH